MLCPRSSACETCCGSFVENQNNDSGAPGTFMTAMEIWDLWYPNAGSQGLSFCRARLAATDAVLVHAAPESLRVEVRDEHGGPVALGDQLRLRDAYFPMTRLRRRDRDVVREDGWPGAEDIGRPVLLPGGAAGIL